MDKPRRRRRKNGDDVTGPKLEVHEQPRLDNVPAAPWIGSAIDPTARGLDTMSDLALRTLANSEFAHLSPQCKSFARHRLDLLMSSEAAAKAAGISMEEAGRVDRGAVATIQAHRQRAPTLNRSSVMESYQALLDKCNDSPGGIAQQVKILAAMSKLGGLDAAPLDLTMFDASGPAEDMARSTMEHVAAGKLTPEDGQRIMGATKGASEVAIHNALANPQRDPNGNPHPAGSVPFLNAETRRRQMENLDYLIQQQANKTLEIDSND